MSSLVRADGTQFIIQAYRETVTATRKNLLVHKARLLSEQQGQYINVVKKEADQFEIILSKEPGYLFAETIREHFKNEKNFVYCEQLPEQLEVILVVVRDGTVVLDTKIDLGGVFDELLPFLVSGERFHFYISEGVPLTLDTNQSEKMLLPEKAVSELTELSPSLFPALKGLPEFQLNPLAAALKNIKLQRTPEITVLYALGGLFVIGILWWIFKPSDVKPTPVKTAAPVVSTYTVYRTALATPAPDQLMNELVAVLENLFFAPGWDLTSVQYTDTGFKAVYTSQTGSVEVLNQWAKKNHYDFHLNSYGVEVTVHSLLKPRPAPTTVYNTDQVTELLIDQFSSLFGQSGVQLGSVTTQGKLKESALTLSLNNVSPELLAVVGNTLKDLPVNVQGIQLNISNGLISGNLQMVIWGI